MGDNYEGWCTIESDPGVFTELIQQIGVKNIQVEELYTLDPSEYNRLGEIYGLIFLFKWMQDKEEKVVSENDNLFFAYQVINNACATQAILSILMNNETIELGEELGNFKSFTKEFPPLMKGEAIGNSDLIRETHNSFSVPDSFIISKKKGKKEEPFHFISYIPFEGKVYELDGLQKGPISLDDCTPENWLEKVTPFIQKRMDKYSQGEIRFNLMAVIKNRSTTLQEKIEKLEKEKVELTSKQSETSTSDEEKSKIKLKLDSIDNEIDTANNEILMEQEKFRNYKEENIRRKHNFLPFILNLIQSLAEKDKLLPLVQKAKDQSQLKQQQSK
ncbi:peptidase C12 family protein [Tieghemostelium lacteum]|uniref:Ubiquitin carboxyl-terminal hydrolase n=1 Tax=Tieghemostelium lacteum TaxID=361077 RepID=A0A151ZEL6_TIELA|nr:peptidase C12 family protein [Tieghemostelium lacteum]|eukprot:KYQ92359.1 peptidase C12 family protein [Tieghemostelium lacteum]